VAEHYPNNDRVDIFKYSMASHAVLLPLISKCIFYIELSDDVIHRKKEIEKFIEEHYPKEKLKLVWKRNTSFEEWSSVFEEIKNIDDEVIWFAGNDDHIFLDCNLETIKEGINLLNTEKNENSFVYYSHWPEQMRLAANKDAELVEGGNYIRYKWSTFDSIIMMKKSRFEKYWDSEGKSIYGRWLLERTDCIRDVRSLEGFCYVPTKEIVRHFDGYGHVSNDVSTTPPLFIPPGFFESSMKIRYGYEDRRNEYTNINPKSRKLFSEWIDGTDYKWHINDFPLFWKSRILEIDKNTVEDSLLKEDRNLHFINSTKPVLDAEIISRVHSMNALKEPPLHWFQNQMLK
jgi:hypothetical protein